MADEVQEVFKLYPTAKWEVGSYSITFPAERIEEIGGNRLVPHERVYRDGARHDDTGSKPRGWQITSGFYNDEEHEEGVDGLGLYPDVINELIDSFDEHEVGTLTTPTRGPRRCRADSYRRVETSEERDACGVVFTWVEDNEDDAKQATYAAPSGKAIAESLVAEAMGACTDEGAWNEDLSSMADFASDLVGMAEAPGEFVSDFEARVNQFEGQVDRVVDAFTQAAGEAQSEAATLLTDPAASRAGRKLNEAREAAASMTVDRLGGETTRPVTYTHEVSIFDVATEHEQDPNALMSLNASLPDMLAIEPNTTILVFGS